MLLGSSNAYITERKYLSAGATLEYMGHNTGLVGYPDMQQHIHAKMNCSAYDWEQTGRVWVSTHEEPAWRACSRRAQGGT